MGATEIAEQALERQVLLAGDEADPNATTSNDPPVYLAEVEDVWDVPITVNAEGDHDEADPTMGVTALGHQPH